MLAKNLSWLCLTFLWTLLDQSTKYLVWKTEGFSLTPFLDIIKVYNRGFVFGFFGGNSGVLKDIFYYAIPTAVLISVVYVLIKSEDRFTKFSLSLIAGGGLGNLIDRVFWGKVRDFIDFHIGSWHYPTFNIADIFISVGIFLITLRLLTEEMGKLKRFKN